MDATLAKTALHDWHQDHGGRMVDFAGWMMPVQYASISQEHIATRTAATLFDVSHMGRFEFVGPSAADWLDRFLTRRVDDLRPGQIRYSLMTAADGNVLDDVLVYRLPFDADAAVEQPADSVYSLVVNAGNRQKIWDWLHHEPAPADTTCIDHTLATAMIAVQGPLARSLVMNVLQRPDLSTLATYTGWSGKHDGSSLVCTRTGYTGEDGFELICSVDSAVTLWSELLAAGGANGVCAAGLGARDTLRLEAAMPLYGHELTEQINPYQAGLKFAVNLKDRQFHGRDALQAAASATWPRRVGLVLPGKRVAREHAKVISIDQNVVGEVTSGTFSPTRAEPIAMAYVDADEIRRCSAEDGRKLWVDIRGTQTEATIVPLPFYKRPPS